MPTDTEAIANATAGTCEKFVPFRGDPYRCECGDARHWHWLKSLTTQLEAETRERNTTREALATAMMTCGLATGHGDTHADLVRELVWQVEELRRAAIQSPTPEQAP